MRFQDTKFWQNYQDYDKIVANSSMRSTVDAIVYWRLLTHFEFTNFLEIGIYQGLTTGLFFESNNHAKVVAIDPNDRLGLFYKNYSEFQNQFTFIQQQSQDIDFTNDLYDFILVDGDHSYQGCYNDLNNWWNKLSVGGHLILHDCYLFCEVQKAVINFLKDKKVEIIISAYRGSNHWHNKHSGSLCHFIKK